MEFSLRPNEGKNCVITVGGMDYQRFPIRTHVITDRDSIPDVAQQYAKRHIQGNEDILFISEKAVACSQKRAVSLKEIHPRRLAKMLCRFVYKSPYGIGLSIPSTMEMALRECGAARILCAAFVSAIGKVFGRRGWFYKVAGHKAAAIDGPTPYTLPPYNECVVLAPESPDTVAKQVSEAIGCRVCIVDINDLGGNILGFCHPEMRAMKYQLEAILKDNPLGQSSEQTPLGIIRCSGLAQSDSVLQKQQKAIFVNAIGNLTLNL
jgi:hypothetical protein